jgi:hypothetical protein
MEAAADKTESQLAAGKHKFLKKFDQNFPLCLAIRKLIHFCGSAFTL